MTLVRIQCPACQTAGEVDEQYLGKRVKCRQCGTAFTVTVQQSATVTSGMTAHGRSLGDNTVQHTPVPNTQPPAQVSVSSAAPPTSSPRVIRSRGAEGGEYRYWAFISYSSKDKAWGRWLHRAIETYGIPTEFVEHRHTSTGHPTPKRFHPVFLDRDELPASADLGAVIREALGASHYLIVICSPNAARSTWVNVEIESFLALGRSEHILAIIVDGEPNSGGDRECFPPALRQFEPIAADARPEGDGKTNAKLKLLAGMLGVNFDALKQRDKRRQRRQMLLTGVAVGLAMLVMATLIGFAVRQSRNAISATQTANVEKVKGDRQRYAREMINVQTAWDQGDMGQLSGLLNSLRPAHTGDEDLRGFEWYYWWRLIHSELLAFKTERNGFQISPDGQCFTMLRSDNRGLVRNTKDGTRLFSFGGNDASILLVCYTPNGQCIATVSEAWGSERGGYVVQLWDAKRGNLLRTLTTYDLPIKDFRFSPDGKRLLLIADGEESMMVCDVESGRNLFTMKDDTADDIMLNFSNTIFSPDSKRLILHIESASGQDIPTVKEINATSGQILLTRKDSGSLQLPHSSNGQYLATGNRDGTVSVRSATTGQVLRTFNGHNEPITCVCFSPDGKRLVSISSTMIMIWPVGGGLALSKINGGGSVANFSPDGKRLLVISGRKAELFNVECVEGYSLSKVFGQRLLTLKGVEYIRFTPDSKRLIGYSPMSGTVNLWDATRGQEPFITPADALGQSICYSPDGQRIAVDDTGSANIFDALSGITQLTIKDNSINSPATVCICFSPDGKRLAITTGGKLSVWDAEGGKKLFTFSINNNWQENVGVCFSPNGKQVITGGANLIYWDATSGKQVRMFEKGGDFLCCSRNGKRIAASNLGGQVRIWDAKNGKQLSEFKVVQDNSSYRFSALCLSPDGTRLVSSGDAVRGEMTVWNTITGQEVLILTGHKEPVNSINFSPDGRRIASTSSNDLTVKIWDAENGLELLSLIRNNNNIGNPTSISFSQDGHRLAVPGDHSVEIWDATPDPLPSNKTSRQ